MDMRSSFLSDIAASEDDDTPRLVYADWLEDNGDPGRASFIRVQCRLASMERFGPERCELQAEEAALWRRHSGAWLNPLAKLATNVGFRRGFPHRCALPATRLVAKADELFAAAPTLRWLRIQKPGPAWAGLMDCPALERLSTLDFNDQRLTRGQVSDLARSPRLAGLRVLGLSGSKGLRAAIADLTHSPHLTGLREIELRGCSLGADGLAAVLDAGFAPNLTRLDLSENQLGADAIRRLARWDGACRLEELTLSEGHTDDDAAQAFASADWAGLRRLALFMVRMGTAGVEALARCRSLSGLRELNLLCDNDQRLAALFASDALASLERLQFNRLPSFDDLMALAEGPLLPRLRSLSTYVGDPAGMAGVLSSPSSAGLCELELHGDTQEDPRRITAAIAGAPHLAGLRKLRFTRMPFGVEAARDLADAAHLAGLVVLDLGACEVSDACAKALAGSAHLNRLRRLTVGGSWRLSDPSLAALEGRFGPGVVTRE